MAKLPSFEIRRRDDEAGINYCESFTPKVDRNGVFSVTLPAHLEPIFSVLSEKARKEFTKGRFQFGRGGDAASDTLEAVKRDLRECLDVYHKCEIVDEVVILYNFTREAHYVVSTNGRVFPDGHAATAAGCTYGEHADWAPNLPRSQSPFTDTETAYSIGFAARVYRKRSFKRATASTVTYVRHDSWKDAGGMWHDIGEQARRLNSFIKISLVSGAYGSERCCPKHGVLEMPYSEEAAKFFADSMQGLCELAERMTRFFGDAAAIQKAIAGNASAALPFHAEER